MRITPQQLQIQLQDLKTPIKGQALKAGAVIAGKILGIQTEAILIQLQDGSSLRAVVEQPERFVEGETLDFKVIESEKDVLPKLEIQTGKTSIPAKEVLLSVDMKVTEGNVKALDVLKSLGLHVTKDNIETLTKNFKFISKIAETIEKAVLPEIKENSPIVKERSQAVAEKLTQMLKFDSVEQLKTTNLKEIVIKLLDLPKEQNAQAKDVQAKDVQEKDIQIKSDSAEVIKETAGVIKAPEGSVEVHDTIVKLGKLLKLNKPFNIKNLTVLNKLTLEESKITPQIKALEVAVKDNADPKLLSLLKGFDPKTFTTEKAVSQYLNELMTSLKNVSDNSGSTRLKAQAEQLMESITFLEKDQDDVSWVQLPVQMNKQMENVDIYFKNDKKEGSKMTKDNAKILIALNTHFLDTVQALVHVKGKDLTIDFRVQHDSVSSLIENHKKDLEVFFEDYNTHVTVENKSKMSFSDFLEEESQHFINVKV